MDALSKVNYYVFRGLNVLVQGSAGTGKSYIIHQLIKKYPKMNFVILAPTGIAARNVNGSTIHSFFKFKSKKFYDPTEKIVLNTDVNDLIKAIDCLIIDEISMVRSDFLTHIDRCFQTALGNDKAFGGKQVVFVGDFFQLDPIADEKELYAIKTYFDGKYAFQCDTWNNLKLKNVNCDVIYRQRGDWRFSCLLEIFRRGMKSSLLFFSEDLKILDLLIDEVFQTVRDKPHLNELSLCMTNRDAQVINSAHEEGNGNKTYEFKGEITGVYPRSERPTDDVLKLKLGSQIMVTANGKNYSNGDRGKIIDLDVRGRKILVSLDRGIDVWLEDVTTENVDLIIDTSDPEKVKFKEKVIGSFRQLPLRLAHAMSVHKSQGMTMDNVYIDFTTKPFAHGQAYVALSRPSLSENVALSRELRLDDFQRNEVVYDFLEKNMLLTFPKFQDVDFEEWPVVERFIKRVLNA